MLQGFVERSEMVPEEGAWARQEVQDRLVGDTELDPSLPRSSVAEQPQAFRLADAQARWEQMPVGDRAEWLARAQGRKIREPAARHLSDERVALLLLADSL